MAKLLRLPLIICFFVMPSWWMTLQANCEAEDTVRLTFPDFIDLTDLQLNGQSASLNPNADNRLRLTEGLNASGSVFARDAISLTAESVFLASFSTVFSFQITNPVGISDDDGQGADGLVFILQTNANNVGGGGGGIGYEGIANSLGVEFDTYNNGSRDQNSGNHVGINFNGTTTSTIVQPIAERLNDGTLWHVWIDYNGETQVLEVRLSSESVRPTDATISVAEINLPATLGAENVFVGFSSGTAGAGGQHDVLDFQFINRYAPNGVCENRSPIITSEPKTTQILQPVVGNPELIDLAGWQVVEYVQGDPRANWVVTPAGDEVNQTANANPSIFLSDFTLSNGQTRGRFTVGNSSDDDFIGFVFGYQDRSNYYLFDWKQRNQQVGSYLGLAGMRVKRFSGDVDPVFWPSVPPGDAEVLYSNSIPWQDPVEYEFQLDFFPGEFEIKITQVSSGAVLDSFTVQDDTYLSGGFGFYNYSQGPVNYKGFDLGFTSSREYVYAVTATDLDEDPLTFSLIEGPDRMSIDPATGVVSWITTSIDIGEHPVTIEVRDGNGGFDRQSYILVVTDSVPVISTEALTTAQSGRLYSYDVNADDPTPNDVLTFSLEAAPLGMTIEPTTGLIEWVPGLSDVGTVSVSIRVEDIIGGFDLQNFDLVTTGSTGNAAPIVTSVAPTQAQVGFEYNYPVVANDAEGNSLTFALISAPQGMTIDTQTGQVLWTPTSQQVGAAEVHIRVNDDVDGYAAQYFSIDVISAEDNDAPIISSTPSQFVLEGTEYLYSIIATDPDGDSLSYLLLEGPELMTVSTSGLVTWQALTTPGTPVRVRVFDGVAYHDQQWVLSSSDGVLRLVLEVSPIVAKQNEAVLVRVVPGAVADPVTANLLIDGLPVDLSNDFVAQISNSEIGEHLVSATITDGNTTVSDSMSFIVVDDQNAGPEIPFNVDNLGFQADGNDILLTWGPPRFNQDSVSLYRIFVDEVLIAELPASARQTELTDLASQSVFTVKVVTVNTFDNASSGAQRLISTPYSNPSNVVAEERDGLLRLMWTGLEPSTGVERYNVYLSDATFSDVSALAPVTSSSGAGTTANISDINNGQVYYVAVTTVNLAGVENPLVVPISATPNADSTPPSIDLLTLNGEPLLANQLISIDSIICAEASDNWLVSRLSFFLNDLNLGVDSESGPDGYCINLPLNELSNGLYQLNITAFDTSGNETPLSVPVEIELAVPSAPQISSPLDQIRTNQTILSVTGTGTPNLEVQIGINESYGEWLSNDATGQFVVDVNLIEEGENRITARQRNRAGESAPSQIIRVILDTQLPSKPIGLIATPGAQGVIELQWSPGSGTGVAGFDIYRSTASFDDLDSAEKINNNLLLNTSFDDLLIDDVDYYYRVVALNDVGTFSDPSLIVQAKADSIGPSAVRISYSTDGALDTATNTYGRGTLAIELEVSELLLTSPFLSITPDAGVPISVNLTKNVDSDVIYTGEVLLDENVRSGLAFAVFSARDRVGNRGTDIEVGAQINIDTIGPIIQSVVVSPEAPILTEQANPTEITATFTLSEPVGSSSSLEVFYSLSGNTRSPVLINNLSQLSADTWQAIFTLPDDAGQSAPENLSFEFSAADELGNIGSNFNPTFSAQVYQGDLPAFAAPFNFRATAIADGRVRLEWFPVEGATAYSLYRRAPGEADLSEYLRLEPGDSYIDDTSTDGNHEYQLASIRMANGSESESLPTDIASAVSDSVKPDAPTELMLKLTSIGVEANWLPPSENGVVFRLYRAAAEPIDPTSLTPIVTELTQPTAIDSNPIQTLPVYSVTAIDTVGNESLPSLTAYLNVDLLPISTLQVNLELGGKPTISWTHNNGISQFDIYLGEDESGVKLNAEAITESQYIDEGYANNSRQYAVVSIDSNSQRSLARSIRLPDVEVSIRDGSVIKRNLINLLEIDIENLSALPVSNSRLTLLANGVIYQSAAFDLAANESRSVSINVPGVSEFPDLVDATLALESIPNAGELIRISQDVNLTVVDAALGLDLETDAFVRGGSGQVRFTLRNTGEQDLQLVTARNTGNSNSSDVVFTLSDIDGNVVSLAPFRQALGEGVVTLANGETVANIPADGSWTSDFVNVSIPADASESLSLLLEINNLYVNRAKPGQARIKGPQRRQIITLSETSYVGSVDSVTPESSFGNVPIVINGQALDRDTQQPVANVDLTIVISNQGFEREFEVLTDTQGNYQLIFEPQSRESGRYIVSALNPELTTRPADAEFVIGRLSVSPNNVNLRLPYLLDYQLPITLSAGDGTTLNNLQFRLDASEQPSGAVPVGIALGFPSVPSLLAGSPVTTNLMITAQQEADQSGELVISIYADESPDDVLTKLRIQYTLSSALPAITHSPSILELGTTLAGSTSGSINLTNRGSVALQGAQIAVRTQDGFAGPDWLTIATSTDIGDIDVGETVVVNLIMQPNGTAPVGVEQLYLEVSSVNATPYRAQIFTVISEDGQGGALLKVTDMYTGTLDSQGRIIQGLAGATVRLQNEVIPDLQYTLASDNVGEVLLEDIPAGRYSAWITADNYQEENIRLRIQPGVVSAQQVFLDYNLIRLEWSVREVTIEDRYQVVLQATFETDVPAAVVMLEPTNIDLPEMQPGDVFYGELSLTNYGLIRAFDVDFNPTQSDQYYQFEYLTSAVPESLEAKEVVTIPYKVTSLNSLPGSTTGSNKSSFDLAKFARTSNTASGAGSACGDYVRCSNVNSRSQCPTGVSDSSSRSCIVRSFGSCSGGGDGGVFNPTSSPYGGGVWPIQGIPGLPPCRGDGDCAAGNSEGGDQ